MLRDTICKRCLIYDLLDFLSQINRMHVYCSLSSISFCTLQTIELWVQQNWLLQDIYVFSLAVNHAVMSSESNVLKIFFFNTAPVYTRYVRYELNNVRFTVTFQFQMIHSFKIRMIMNVSEHKQASRPEESIALDATNPSHR